jgi:hypothetical protein
LTLLSLRNNNKDKEIKETTLNLFPPCSPTLLLVVLAFESKKPLGQCRAMAENLEAKAL